MKHLKTQMLFYTSLVIFLSCLLINLISTIIYGRMNLQERYLSCQNDVRQIQQNVDRTVRTAENSMTLVLSAKTVSDSLSETDFGQLDGSVFAAQTSIDAMLRSFEMQFPSFTGMVFFDGAQNAYCYNYYNPSMDIMKNLFTKEKIAEISQSNRYNWEGTYRIDNKIGKEYAYLVTKPYVQYSNLKTVGVIGLFLATDVFSSIYQPSVKSFGGKVFLFDNLGKPVEQYEEESLEQLQVMLRGQPLELGELRQMFKGDQLFTLTKSAETGWITCIDLSMRVLTNNIRNVIVMNTLVSLIIIALFGILQFRYISRISDDIVQVSDAMQMVETQDFTLRLHTRRKDEIGQIYSGFNRMSENLAKYFAKARQEEKSKREAEIRALFYQIKPHFLYNTLASIRMFAMKQGCKEIVDMLGTLNRLLRNTINVRDHMIPLSEELQNLNDYIKIFSVRYNHRIYFTVEIPAELEEAMIPNMVLQPLVENAIEHGVGEMIHQENRHCSVQIFAKRVAGDLLLFVEDNGTGMTDLEMERVLEQSDIPAKEGHIGLSNIDSRLKTLYGEGYGVTFESEKEKYTRICLRIPFKN